MPVATVQQVRLPNPLVRFRQLLLLFIVCAMGCCYAAKRQKYQSVWMTVRDNLVPESPCLVVW